jgi:hypothetical protein
MQTGARTLLLGLAVGTAGSLLAAAIMAFLQASTLWVETVLVAAFLISTGHALALRASLQTLNRLGIKRWEQTLSSGTNTQACIRLSQRNLCFLGIAATKWLADPAALRQMLLRHASNGGRASFLLLDPDSAACREFEAIKQRADGSLGKRIRENAATLLKLRDSHFRLDVRFYADHPRFRIVIIDDSLVALGLYSYVSELGEDSPQLILDSAPRPWSYYYAFNAFFTSLWERSIPADLAEKHIFSPVKEGGKL